MRRTHALLAAAAMTLTACTPTDNLGSTSTFAPGLLEEPEFIDFVGVVADATTLKALPRATACVLGLEQVCVRSDGDGRFVLPGVPLGARIAVQVQADGYGPAIMPIAASATPRTVRLYPQDFLQRIAASAHVTLDPDLGHVQAVAYGLAEGTEPIADLRLNADNAPMGGVAYRGKHNEQQPGLGGAWIFNAVPGVWAVDLSIPRADFGGELLCSAQLGWDQGAGEVLVPVRPGHTTFLQHLCVFVDTSAPDPDLPTGAAEPRPQ